MSGHESQIIKSFKAPDGGWGWLIILSTFLIHFILDGITNSTASITEKFERDFKVSTLVATVPYSTLQAVYLLSGPIGSSLTNRFGSRLTAIFGVIIAIFGFILTAFVQNIYFLWVSIGVVIGIGFGIIYVPAIVGISYYFEKRRTIAMAIAVSGTGFGTFVFPEINRVILEKTNLHGLFLVQASAFFIIFICALLMKPLPIEPSEIRKRKQASKRQHQTELKAVKSSVPIVIIKDGKDDSANESRMSKFGEVLRSNTSLNILAYSMHSHKVSNFLTSLGFYAPYLFITDQAKSYTNTTDQAFGSGVSEYADRYVQVIGISNTIGRLVIGVLCSYNRVNRVYLYSTILTICGVATVIEPYLRTASLLVTYSCIFGFTSGGYVSMTSIVLGDLLGLENLTYSFGVLLLFQGAATAIGPIVAGALKDKFGSYTIPFMFLGIATTISGVMCFFIPCLKSRGCCFDRKKDQKKNNISHETLEFY